MICDRHTLYTYSFIPHTITLTQKSDDRRQENLTLTKEKGWCFAKTTKGSTKQTSGQLSMTDPKYRTATATTLGKSGAGGGGQGGGGHERPETAALATAAAAAGAECLYPSLQNYHHVLIKDPRV